MLIFIKIHANFYKNRKWTGFMTLHTNMKSVKVSRVRPSKEKPSPPSTPTSKQE